MAKAKLQEKHTISVEGTLSINENDEIQIEIEELGTKSLSEILAKFNGCYIKLNAGYGVDIIE